MNLKHPHEYAADALKVAQVNPEQRTYLGPAQRVAEIAVTAAMRDFIVRLCEADYEGTAPTQMVSEILQLVGPEEDPRQLKLDFGS